MSGATVEKSLPTPLPGKWIALAFKDGGSTTCRFVSSYVHRKHGTRWWSVDHGAYGVFRSDSHIPVAIIAAFAPAERPILLLTFRDPYGKLRRVGRFATEGEAQRAIGPIRSFATDIRITAS